MLHCDSCVGHAALGVAKHVIHRNRKSLGSQITNHTWQPVAPVEGRLPVAPHWALEVKGREASSNTSATIPVQLVSTCIDLPFIQILNLFNDSGLPEEVAMKLVAPYGEFAYPLHMNPRRDGAGAIPMHAVVGRTQHRLCLPM